MDKELLLKSHFHFIGIGGIGMSALAMGLLKKGCSVSGSDLVKNDETNKLEKLGEIILLLKFDKILNLLLQNLPTN